MNFPNIFWIIVAVAVVCLLSWLFYSAKGDAVRLLSMIVLAIILVERSRYAESMNGRRER
jgi:hypothetical protein